MKHAQLAVVVAALLMSSAPRAAETPDIQVIRDIPYLENAGYADKKDLLDIYTPALNGRAPVVFFVHGGGLLAGDKAGQGHVGQRFAGDGFVTVVVNHRLSPGVMHPAHIKDIAAAFAWTHKHVAEYGGDPDNIFVVGHSAGAYLIALLALDGRYLEAHGLSLAHVRGAVPISGFFHVERVAPGRPKSVWGEDEQAWLNASPSEYVGAGAPPFLCMYADGDVPERRQESEDLVQELHSAGNKAAQSHQSADRTHITIWQRLNSENDETSRLTVEFMKGLVTAHE